jgi:hypothetical protein
VTPELQTQVADLLGARPVAWEARDEGGYSGGGRWTVRLDGGRSVFVKHHGRRILHAEHIVYAACGGGPLPELVAYAELPLDGQDPPPGPPEEGDEWPAVLVIEDLSEARWGTPITEADVRALADALDELTSADPPGLPRVSRDIGQDRLPSYAEGLLRNGLLDDDWASRHLATVHEVASTVDPRGDRLVHPDLFVQNWCRADRGAVLVDWAWSFVGDPMFARAWAEAGVRTAGGPGGLLVADRPEWAAAMAVLWCGEVAGPVDGPLTRLQETERREAHAALRWACAELDLPLPVAREDFLPPGPWRP